MVRISQELVSDSRAYNNNTARGSWQS